jgi:hypothetical protein
MKIISLGWGVQSFTLAAMSAIGDLPKVDAAIHADTRHESILTYEFSKRWTSWLAERGVNVVTVQPLDSDFYNRDNLNGLGAPPLYTASKNKGDGQMMRSCTQRWKIAPIRRWLQENRKEAKVEQWIGISLDEFQRMKESQVSYIKHYWPLIDKKMTRSDCILWLQKNGIEVPVKSSCTFCPYHNTAEWTRVKNTPSDWQEAVLVDDKIRDARLPYKLFVHPSRKPLSSIDFRTPQEKGQLDLWEEECEGICGI